MKKQILCSIVFMLLLLNGMNTQAQTNQNWAPIGAKWYYGLSQTSSTSSFISIECIGQQVFLGKMVKLLQQKTHTYNPLSGYQEFVDAVYKTYEDSGKVYYWANNQFYKLYDFVSPVGSEWNIYGTQASWCDTRFGNSILNGRVVKIKDSTQTINNQTYKFFLVDTAAGFRSQHLVSKTIEKLGNIKFLLPQWYNYCNLSITYNAPSLRCYTESGQIVYQATSSISIPCDYLAGYTAVDEKNGYKIALYPSVFSHFINVETQNTAENAILRVRDVLGKTVFEANIFLINHVEIDLSSLPQAIYSVDIVSANNNRCLLNQKIVKL